MKERNSLCVNFAIKKPYKKSGSVQFAKKSSLIQEKWPSTFVMYMMEQNHLSKCELCAYASFEMDELTIHIHAVHEALHEEKKLFKCVICNYTFAR